MMQVKKICLLTLIFITTLAHAAKPVVVSKKMYGDEWPFKRQEMMLECRQGSQLFAISEGTLARYALNSEAYEATKNLKTFIPLEDALKESPLNPNSKMDYSNIVKKAQTLCE
ncbi:DUF2511 domain-containing protein [Thorsellia anophelis]|uniref:DUF2511 domain-containing protein n=1 Tax=Thorsellia anophelis DSM 18579 TaxID=1123402 RepID=A0A1I0C894_9GAMM|nr:DUF2511 domain-containing protein [Thorsellia anophelis]SET15306.1 Protein of unknown function [Thorsellia anophelis DSM 18579]